MDFEPAASFAFVLAYNPTMQQETSQVDKGPSPTICAGFAHSNETGQSSCTLRLDPFSDLFLKPGAGWPSLKSAGFGALCDTRLVVFGRGGKGSAGPGALTGVRSAVKLSAPGVGAPARVGASFLGPGSAIAASGASTLGSETAAADLSRLLGRTSTGALS